MKKTIILAVALIVVIAAAAGFLIYKNDQLTTEIGQIYIDARNSDRYQDTLVLYTSHFDRNQFGYEILVEKRTGYVLDADINVDMVDDTYVLSGHGVAADFLRQVAVGDKVKMVGDSVTVTRNIYSSNLKKIEIENDKVDKIVQERRAALWDVDTDAIAQLDKQIANGKADLIWHCLSWRGVDTQTVQQMTENILELVDRKYYNTIERRAVEGRGMWHRPNASGIDESNLDGVKKFVARLDEIGVNTLYVETFWQGMTTYKSDVLGLQHPKMANNDYGEYGNDYTLALISECHKVGIEVHAWVEVLNAGIAGLNPPFYVKSQWLCQNLDGDTSDNYFDPTHTEVQKIMFDLVGEMVQKYDFDGISYDYIRYAETGEHGGYIDCGFTDNSIALFSSQYGYGGTNLVEDLKQDVNLRADWHKFKQDAVTNFVGMLSAHIRTVNPNVVISASPYGYIDDARTIYMQDIDTWLSRGYLDVVLPMVYTEDAELLVATVNDYEKYADRVLQYTGISPLYNGASIHKNQSLTNAVQGLGVSGFSFFASQNYITKNAQRSQIILDVLSSTTHSGDAVTPTSDANVVFVAWKNLLMDRYERIYSAYVTENEDAIIRNFDAETQTVMQNPRGVADMIQKLTALKSNLQTFQNVAVRNKIADEIDYIYHILDANISRQLIRGGYWDAETEPQRPDVYSIDFDN